MPARASAPGGNTVEACFEGTLWRLYIVQQDDDLRGKRRTQSRVFNCPGGPTSYFNASDFCLAALFAQALATMGK